MTVNRNDASSKVVGADKHITFGGRTAGGVNIPGGLRMPQPADRTGSSQRRITTPATFPSEKAGLVFIGGEKHIRFGGHSAGGVNIPSGLRMPVKRAG